MFTKIKEYSGLVAIIVLVLILVVAVFVPTAGKKLGNATASFVEADGGFQITSSGTLVTGYMCNSATWNPASVASNTAINLDVATPGVSLGDVEFASLATSTQGLQLEANASTTATSTVILSNTGIAAVDIATTTVKVCYSH